MATAGKMNVCIGVKCSDNMAQFCIDMLNIYLQDHCMDKELVLHWETPEDRFPYQKIALEAPKATTETKE